MTPVLYELVPHKDHPTPSISPAVWTTKLDFAFLGIEYTRKPLTFAQIRGEFAKETGNDKVTVPTVYDGKYITDSYIIAEHYGERVFGDKKYAKFIECFKPSVQEIIRPLVMSRVYARLDEESADYVRNRKIGPETIDKWIDIDKNHFDEQCRLCRKALQPLERMLSQSEFMGETMGHADFAVFGVYAWTRMSPEAAKEIWEHDEMPGLKAWVQRMMNSGLVRKEDLP